MPGWKQTRSLKHGVCWCTPLLLIPHLGSALPGLFDSSLLPWFSMGQNHWENLYGIFVSMTRGVLLIFIWWKPRMLNILQSPGQCPVVKSYPTSCRLPNAPPELPIDKNCLFHMQIQSISCKVENMLNSPGMRLPYKLREDCTL